MAYSVVRSADRLSIIVPRRFDAFLFAFFPLWTAGWIGFAVNSYKSGVNQSAVVSSLFALILFGVVTVLLPHKWLWNIGGREELGFTATALQHQRVLFGISRTRVFRMNQIAEPHFVESVRRTKSRTPSGLGFRYGSEQVRIGDNLTRQEAREIVNHVTRQFPPLASIWSHYAEGLLETDELLSLRLR